MSKIVGLCVKYRRSMCVGEMSNLLDSVSEMSKCHPHVQFHSASLPIATGSSLRV